jgi:hypothetical protein
VLRRIYLDRREVGELTGGWRKMHNEELHNSYSSLGHVARMRGEGDWI